MHNEPKIIKVLDLLTNDCLRIPNYQRPYKWSTKNVNQLIEDILIHQEKSEYRLGTLVVHFHNDFFDIVDGQQRTITLTLIAYAIINKQKKTKEEEKISKSFEIKLLNLPFTNEISKANIQNNYKEIERRIAEFDEKLISFFLNKCTLIQVTLNDISEAFQFFDSQNTRGKDLEPHDLLKAFHLREMTDFSTEEERKKVVGKWESIDTIELSKLFSQYLFRIRNWSKGYSAKYFSKNDIETFKGVNPNIEEYSFIKMLRITNLYVEDYNRSYHRNIDKHKMSFPFQIDGTIINGKRFFEMISHYQSLINHVKSKEMYQSYPLLNIINTYEGSFRTGDRYIRNLFYCGLIYYIDKFGNKDLSKVIDKIFIWAYSLRLKLERVQLDSVDNFALNKKHSQIQLFIRVRDAIKPKDILNIRFDIFKENKSSKTEAIVEEFRKLKYYEE